MNNAAIFKPIKFRNLEVKNRISSIESDACRIADTEDGYWPAMTWKRAL